MSANDPDRLQKLHSQLQLSESIASIEQTMKDDEAKKKNKDTI